MGALIRSYPWASSPLGPAEDWPISLKTLVGLMLGSTQPMFIVWGPHRVWLHNDAMTPLMGKKHPGALGQQALDTVWSEARESLAPMFASVFAGTPVQMDDISLELDRHGKLEEAHFSFSYTPVREDSGEVSGLFGACTDTTATVMADRRRSEEIVRQRRLFEQAPGFIIIMREPDHVVEFVNDAHRRMFNSDSWSGKPLREAFPSIEGQGFFELLDKVYATGETFEANGAEVRFRKSPDAPEETRYLTFIYAPLYSEDQTITGVFCEGFDVTGAHVAEKHTRALADLGDRIRDIEDPDQLAYAAAEILGKTLGVSRSGYGTINAANETISIERDWNMPGVQSLAGLLHFRDYGSYIEDLKCGVTVVMADAEKDPRTAATADALKAISAQSFVNMPVTEQGGIVALLYLNNATAREWSPGELRLIREVAERTRTAVERRRAETALLRSEDRLRFLDALSREAAKLNDANAILRTTTRMVGEYMRVAVCAYADMDADQDGFTIRGDWAAPGSISIVGHYSLADFGKLAVKNLSAGRPLVLCDNSKELPAEEAATFQSIGVAATICMPLVKDDRLTALMAIHDRKPRVWTHEELSLIREVTERSWAHIERVGAEAELRASEANFRTLTRAMPNQAWTSQPDGMLDWFNEQVYAYSGAEPGALDGVGWASMVHPDDVPPASARWAEALQSGETYQTEFRLRHHDGTFRWHLGRAVPIKDSSGNIIRWIGTNTDIHDQKEAAATLEQRVDERTSQLMLAEEALRQSQKMEAVGQLTGGIAHDFNNLLTGISGSLELLAKRLAEGRTAGVERYVTSAQEASQRAAALTQRLLAFSRRQTLDPKPVDVNKLIAGMEDLIRRSVGPDVQLEVVHAGGLWPTKIDGPQLENALLNLCINARDAMAPEGGRLTIETANKWLDDRAARDRDLPPGQYLSLCVTDTGTGMTQEVIDRAFDPFFTTKPLGQGTGLGLSMVYGFVRQSGGQVRIYSEIGVGTTMCLYLPRYFGAVEDALAGPSLDAIERGDGETVLVVDDEAILRMLMLDILQENGYRAIEASDGPSALKILDSSVRIDLLITDVGLPGGMNGRQVADAGRRTRPDLKVLFITGYAENAVVGNGHLAPGMEIVTKPFEIAALGQKVRDMIER